MLLIKNIKKLKGIKSPVITLGNFDGVHTGHQKVLKAIKERAKKLKLPSVVYTFEPHPLKVVAPHKSPPLLTTLEEKIRLIKASAIEYLKKLGQELGFKIYLVPAYKKRGVIVSSSKIREYIQNGKIKEAAEFLEPSSC